MSTIAYRSPRPDRDELDVAQEAFDVIRAAAQDPSDAAAVLAYTMAKTLIASGVTEDDQIQTLMASMTKAVTKATHELLDEES